MKLNLFFSIKNTPNICFYKSKRCNFVLLINKQKVNT